NFVGRIFEHREAALRRREHRHRAGFAEAKRALHIGGDEMTLEAERLGRELVDDGEKIFVDAAQAPGPGRQRRASDRTGSHVACAGTFDDAVTAYRTPGIHPEYPHTPPPQQNPRAARPPRTAPSLRR